MVAVRPIAKGEKFDAGSLGAMRPGNGVSPYFYWKMIGRTATKAYKSGDLIDE